MKIKKTYCEHRYTYTLLGLIVPVCQLGLYSFDCIIACTNLQVVNITLIACICRIINAGPCGEVQGKYIISNRKKKRSLLISLTAETKICLLVSLI